MWVLMLLNGNNGGGGGGGRVCWKWCGSPCVYVLVTAVFPTMIYGVVVSLSFFFTNPTEDKLK